MSKPAHQDAISLLEADHREAEDLFAQYEKAKDAEKTEEKFEIARKVCAALLIHMQVEETIFYPAARAALDEEGDDLLNEAEVEHNGAKDLIKQLGETKPDDPMFDAKVKVLSEQIEHHVDEEENELFPKLKKTDLDLDSLGDEMAQAKEDLKEQLGA
ncbi:hemerythrin domain-containing protein [Undibacterium sp. Di27W]|uniref:hemerythrin domain-containing protein n=1 Tax=Undibacterium sp. Di27W TaxID=3413036 RepID=UPI003BF17A90